MNPKVFGTDKPAVADAENEAGGKAYSRDAKEALAQFACTGTFNNTYYASANTQLDTVKKLAAECDSKFLCQLAVYARRHAWMKDTPAVLLAIAGCRGDDIAEAFGLVVDNGRMLRNFVQAIRSGEFGRKSLGSRMKKLVQRWLNDRRPDQLFRDSVGNSPSIADVVKMVHPKPVDVAHKVMFSYLLGKLGKPGTPDEDTSFAELPQCARVFEWWKGNDKEAEPKGIPHRMLTQLDLTPEDWERIAAEMGWTALRMNLNTLLRHDALKQNTVVAALAEKLRDPEQVRRARAFPYQLLTAYKSVSEALPRPLVDALHDAMEVATENVPTYGKRVLVCVDTAGSMQSPATGERYGATTATTCVDVAALFAAVIARRNPDTKVILFDTAARLAKFEPRDSVMTVAKEFTKYGGGTDCGCALRLANGEFGQKHDADLVVFVSDNQSWYGQDRHYWHGTGLAEEWQKFKRRCKGAKLVCIDVQPYETVQAKTTRDVLNVGGFSDTVFEVIGSFLEDNETNWTDVVESGK